MPKLFPQAELLISAAHVLMLSSAFLRKMLHLLQIDLFWVLENEKNNFWAAAFRLGIAFSVLVAVTSWVVPSA